MLNSLLFHQVRIEKAGGKKLKLDSSVCEDKETLSASESVGMEDCEIKRKNACSKVIDVLIKNA